MPLFLVAMPVILVVSCYKLFREQFGVWHLLQDKLVLDVGAGSGILSMLLASVCTRHPARPPFFARP